ncbi:MAG: hypothetical protein K1060chlam2_01199 [Chlamydiae bacterium]|nr:hypothetical protein [Chlamydiota bacterium]
MAYDLLVNTIFIRDNYNPNLAAGLAQFISDWSRSENLLVSQGATRVAALIMPLAVSVSTLQLGGVLATDIVHMTLTGDWDSEALRGDLVDLIKMVGALFAQIVVWPLTIVYDPSLYQRVYIPTGTSIKFLDVTKPYIDNLPSITLTPENFDDHVVKINQIPGITLQKIGNDYSYTNWNPNWNPNGVRNGEDIPLANAKNIVRPDGSLEITLACNDQYESALIHALLKTPHKFHSLVIDGRSALQFLFYLNQNSVKLSLNLLVFKDIELTRQDLEECKRRFPTVTGYDWSEATVRRDENLNAFKREKLYISSEDNNVRLHFNALYTKMAEAVQKERKDLQPFLSRPSNNSVVWHIAAPFVSELSLLKGTNITDLILVNLIRGNDPLRPVNLLRKYFPNMRALNLENCKHLTRAVLPSIRKLELKKVSFKGCPDLLYEFIPRNTFRGSRVISIHHALRDALGENVDVTTVKRSNRRRGWGVIDVAHLETLKNRTVFSNGEFLIEEGEPVLGKVEVRVYKPSLKTFISEIMVMIHNGTEYIDLSDIRGLDRDPEFVALLSMIRVFQRSNNKNIQLTYYDSTEGANRTTPPLRVQE